MYLVEFIEGCVWWVEGVHVLIVLWVAISWNCARYCCYIINSWGDTKQYSHMNKMSRNFFLWSKKYVNGDSCSAPSKPYVEEVVKDIHNGERGECQICLESVNVAVLTPCAHHMCRECLLGRWRNSLGGSFPVCMWL